MQMSAFLYLAAAYLGCRTACSRYTHLCSRERERERNCFINFEMYKSFKCRVRQSIFEGNQEGRTANPEQMNH